MPCLNGFNTTNITWLEINKHMQRDTYIMNGDNNTATDYIRDYTPSPIVMDDLILLLELFSIP
jgi:hypothetical protein